MTSASPEPQATSEWTITLTREEFDMLLVALGHATRAAAARKDKKLTHNFVRLVNAVNRGNPQWTPYDLSQEPK